MKDILGAAIFLAAFLFVFLSITRYAYLAWFRSDKFLDIVKSTWPAWERRLLSPVGKWVQTPNDLWTMRITALGGVLFCVFIVILIGRSVAITLISGYGK